MYTIVEAARVLSVDAGQLARWVALGRIPDAVMVDADNGPVWRIPRETVDRVAHQLSRSQAATPIATKAVPTAPPQPAPVKRAQPMVTWDRVETIVARERAHWQRLAELQADTISGLRTEIEQTKTDLRHLRERLAEFEEGRELDGFLGRATLPMMRQALTPLSFPELEMA